MADNVHDAHDAEAHAQATHEMQAVAHDAGHDDHATPNPITPDIQMVIWTWVVFGVVAALLYKVAWKPILAGLDLRETKIRDALDSADKAKAELAALEERRQKLMAETEAQARETVAKAQEAATGHAQKIETEARRKVEALYSDTEREIDALKLKAINEIKREQADMIISLAGRLVAENMDSEKNRNLTDRLIKEL